MALFLAVIAVGCGAPASVDTTEAASTTPASVTTTSGLVAPASTTTRPAPRLTIKQPVDGLIVNLPNITIHGQVSTDAIEVSIAGTPALLDPLGTSM